MDKEYFTASAKVRVDRAKGLFDDTLPVKQVVAN